MPTYRNGDTYLGFEEWRAVQRAAADEDERDELLSALTKARAAAHGDSNDGEIAAWQNVGDLLEAHLLRGCDR